MIIRKLGDKKPNVVIFQGSPRDKETCANMDSKSHIIVDYMLENWSPFINFKVIDLAVNQYNRPTIQPCKGCVSTAGGYHCHFPCSCYNKGGKIPDLLHEEGVYELLQECDAFIIVSPIHWHSLTAQIKTLFDRLVCINLTMNVWDAINVLGRDNIKRSEVTGKLSKTKKYNHLLRNHLEGKVACFYAHGDDGANDYNDRELPDSYSDVLDDGFSNNPKNVVMPFVMQLKYSGVYVPDELIQAFYVNKGVDYYTANLTVMKNRELFERADTLLDNLLNYLSISNEK